MIKAAAGSGGDDVAAGMELLRSYGFEPVRLASGFGPGMVLLTLAGLALSELRIGKREKK